MAAARTPPPPPVIGKAGSYTVFITPPPTPPSSESARSDIVSSLPSLSPESTRKEPSFPVKAPTPASPPPVQVPPPQFAKPAAKSSGSVFGFFRDAVAKVQDVHSSLDEYMADWFGLDQSKYQWALNDYYEHSGKEKASFKITKVQQLADKGQTV